MKRPWSKLFIFLTQGVGVVFFAIFLLAFYLPMPSNETLIGNSNFRTPLSILGAIFLIMIIISIASAYVGKRTSTNIQAKP
jgi:uncharacterized membrane protein YjfL (UPF0719 family)